VFPKNLNILLHDNGIFIKVRSETAQYWCLVHNQYPNLPVLNMTFSQAPVAHTCNPSYLGGRVLEDCSLRPAYTGS
jgi:hypothetical protein